MTADLLVENVRVPAGGPIVAGAVAVRDGIVQSVGAAPTDWTGPRVDGGGDLCLPGFIDGHAHIATTLWGQPWRPHRAEPGLTGLLAHQREGRRGLAPVAERAAGLLAAYRDHGTTHVRAHVDVDPEIGLGHIEGALEAAARFAGVIDVELVAFPQQGMLISPGTAELMAAAVDAGATVVGGIDPAGLDGDPVTALNTLFGLADRSGAAIDLHLHDRGDLGRWEMGLIIERTVALGLQGRITVSHAFCLCDGSPAVEPLLERLAEHHVAIATVAPGAPDPLPLLRMLDIGVGVCLGSDGIRDLWSPWGDADLLHRAGLLAWRSGFRRDEYIEAALSTTTTVGARALGLPERGPVVGARADLVLVPAEVVAEAVVAHPERTLVVKAGRPVAGGRASTVA